MPLRATTAPTGPAKIIGSSPASCGRTTMLSSVPLPVTRPFHATVIQPRLGVCETFAWTSPPSPGSTPPSSRVTSSRAGSYAMCSGPVTPEAPGSSTTWITPSLPTATGSLAG